MILDCYQSELISVPAIRLGHMIPRKLIRFRASCDWSNPVHLKLVFPENDSEAIWTQSYPVREEILVPDWYSNLA